MAAGLLGVFALFQAVATNNFQDFFIYRIGAVIGLRGESPYDIPLVRALVAAQFPDPEPREDSFVNNCGYFPPPLAILVYAPFAVLPWPAAKVLWAVTTFLAAWAVTLLPGLFRRPGDPPPQLAPLVRWLLPFLLLFNPLTLAIVVVGQTTLLFAGCVAAGQWCFDRGRPWLGALLWAVPFVKPHLALPLIVLAWYLGGWRRAALVLGVVAGLNLLGATVAGGTPLFLKDYLEYVPTAHKAVLYNRAELNPQITSWNRLLYDLTRPAFGERFLIELTVKTTVAGYLVWFGLLAGRVALVPPVQPGERSSGGAGRAADSERPSPSWAAAAAVVGGLVCCQVLGYEVLLLAVLTPWVRDLFAGGWRVRAWAAVALMVVQLLPLPPEIMEAVGSHRSVGAALLGLLVLVGPVNPRPRG